MSDDQHSEQSEKWRPLTEDMRFFWKRVHALSDMRRRMIVGLNMAGIVALGALASWLWTEQEISHRDQRGAHLGKHLNLFEDKSVFDGKLVIEVVRFGDGPRVIEHESEA